MLNSITGQLQFRTIWQEPVDPKSIEQSCLTQTNKTESQKQMVDDMLENGVTFMVARSREKKGWKNRNRKKQRKMVE